MMTEPTRANKELVGFLSQVMRFLIWLLILCWGVALLRRAIVWMLRGLFSPPAPREGTTASDVQSASSHRLVRDPVCGVHVTEDRAIPLRTGKEVVHFCSVACRDRYAGNEQKFAASA